MKNWYVFWLKEMNLSLGIGLDHSKALQGITSSLGISRPEPLRIRKTSSFPSGSRSTDYLCNRQRDKKVRTKTTRKIPFYLTVLAILTGALSMPGLYALDAEKPVKVFLWFDTEDYILPEADGALLRISEFLRNEGIRGTFKIVGEKARVLEERGRDDIIRSLRNHEIGYHTDFHSAQPSPAMYLSDLDWGEGVREFTRREYQGFLDVKRITGQEIYCYGQPGASWGPQAFESLRKWGVKVYLDSNNMIDIDKKPFWFSGVLTLCSLEHEMRVGLQKSSDLDEARERFSASREKILSADEPGVVSIFYHPCEFVHSSFWDGVNFSRGANPAPNNWKNPPVKSRKAIETGYQNFEGFIKYIKSFPDVEFVTARQALQLFPDQSAMTVFSEEDIRLIAENVRENGIKYQVVHGVSLSAAEVFYLLASRMDDLLNRDNTPGPWELADWSIGGPTTAYKQDKTVVSTIDQYRRTLRDVLDFARFHKRIPDSVWLGGYRVTPESFLAETASIITEGVGAPADEKKIEFQPARLESRDHINSSPSWDWVIFPKDFDAPEMVEKARIQTWSLKPAIAARSDKGR